MVCTSFRGLLGTARSNMWKVLREQDSCPAVFELLGGGAGWALPFCLGLPPLGYRNFLHTPHLFVFLGSLVKIMAHSLCLLEHWLHSYLALGLAGPGGRGICLPISVISWGAGFSLGPFKCLCSIPCHSTDVNQIDKNWDELASLIVL